MKDNKEQAVAIVPPDLQLDRFVRNVRRIAKSLGIDYSYYCPVYEAALDAARVSSGSSLDVARRAYIKSISDSLTAVVNAEANGVQQTPVLVEWASDSTAGSLRQLSALLPRFAFVPEILAAEQAPTLAFDGRGALLRESPVPLWIVNPGPAIDARPNILVALDAASAVADGDRHSPCGGALVEQAQRIAAETGGTTHLLAIYEPGAPLTHDALDPASGGLDAELEDQRELEYRRHVEALAQRHGFAREQVHVRRGKLSAVIRALAEPLDVGLVILGRLADEPLRTLASGESLSDLLKKMPTDTLVLDAA